MPTGHGLRSKVTGPLDTSVLCLEGAAVLLGRWDKASRVGLIHSTVWWAKRLGQTQHDSPITVDIRPAGHPTDHNRRPHPFQGLSLWAQLVPEASWAFLAAARQTTHLRHVVDMVSSGESVVPADSLLGGRLTWSYDETAKQAGVLRHSSCFVGWRPEFGRVHFILSRPICLFPFVNRYFFQRTAVICQIARESIHCSAGA